MFEGVEMGRMSENPHYRGNTNKMNSRNSMVTGLTEYKISSTNDLTHPKFRLNFQLFGLTITTIQLVVLVMIILNSYKSEVRGKGYENVFSFIFTTAYLSNYASDNISTYLAAKMKLFEMNCLSGMKVDLSLLLDHKADSSVFKDLMVGFETIFVFSINNMVSVGWFYAFFIREALLMNPEADTNVSDFGWSKRVVRMLGVFSELWTMMIAMFASCLVSASGKDMLEKIFSFGAVLVVLELDDLAIRSLPEMFFEPLKETDEKLKKINFVTANCVQGVRIVVCGACFIFYSIIFAGVLHK